jgi:GNAT superfamily N-acetyltransferase
MHISQSGFILRPYELSDSGHVVEVINADARQSLGYRRALVDAVGNVRLIRHVPPFAEKVVALDGDGQVSGYAYLADREQSIIYETGGAVHPAYYNRGVGLILLGWAEDRAAEKGRAARSGVQTVLQVNAFEAETRSLRLLEAAEFTHVRDWLHFEIVLPGPPAMPDLPAGVSLDVMDLDNDWDLVGPAMDEAFADHWGTLVLPADDETVLEVEDVANNDDGEDETSEDETYSNSPGFCFYARTGDMVVGGILCNAKLVEREDTGRVGSLFVRPAYRRQGLGRALMQIAFRTFWQHGLRRVILDTDAESFTAAPRFYTSLGMKVYRRERLYEKIIRPGTEARRLFKQGEGNDDQVV